eukprot:236661_1
MPSFSNFSSLLDPAGRLSGELLNVLNGIFMKYSSGVLVMTSQCVSQYYKACYPGLSQETYYTERAQYILNKYGKRLCNVKQKLKRIMASDDANLDLLEITDTYSGHSCAYIEEKEEEKTKTKHHTISIKESKTVIEATLNFEAEDDAHVLLKTKFLLLYRKWCVDKPMMVRLELTCLGFEQFRSGMMVDHSKQLDKIAFNIQQLRNRYITHKEERKRISSAMSPEQCAATIESFIQKNQDPFDIYNDANNLFRKRRPIKFPKICHACCCCGVALIRCCES